MVRMSALSQTRRLLQKCVGTALPPGQQRSSVRIVIQACTTDFLDVSKRRRIKDNVTRKQPEAPRSPRNLPVSHGVACRYAEKSGVTVITDLECDDKKVVQKLHDPHHYDILPSDLTESVINTVKT